MNLKWFHQTTIEADTHQYFPIKISTHTHTHTHIHTKLNKRAMMALDCSPESISAKNEFELIFGSIEQNL